MLNQLRTSLFNRSIWLLAILIAAGYAGNYFKLPFGFGVDFLFGSIAVLIIVSLYGLWWGTIAVLIAGSYTIALWQHPYALIIFTCEALFVAWRLRQGNQNLLLVDMIFWLLIGMPLVWLFYGKILDVGTVTTSIILFKQPVNGIFNALVASLILTYKPLYRWAKFSRLTPSISFEQTLLNLLVAFVFLPTLMLMVVNNKVAMKHEQTVLIETLKTSAHNVASDIIQWHQSGLKALHQLADVSSQTEIENFEQMQQSLKLATNTLPIFQQIYVVNADLEIVAAASRSNQADSERPNFSQLAIPREPQIFVLPTQTKLNSVRPQLKSSKILQTLPIIRNDRWSGNIVAELNMDFIKQLLQTESYTLPLKSILLDENQLVIASTYSESNLQKILNRRSNGEITYVQSRYLEPGVYHWLPTMEGKPLIARWQESFYGQDLPIDQEIPLTLIMEAPAAPHINYLQLLYIRSLSILLLIAISAILIAKFLSRLLVKPILSLAKFTTNLPDQLLQHKTIKWPRSSVREMNSLATNFEVMSKTIEENIQQIQQTNQKFKQAKESAEIANQAKDKFLANISHELKTPLNNIIGYNRLMQKYLADSNSITSKNAASNPAEWLKIVQQSSTYLLTLIDEILDLAKTEAHKMELYPSLVNLPVFMGDIFEIIAKKAAEKNILFKYEALGSLPTNIYADDQRLRQVLLNLLNNSVKFTDRGQITLRVSAINQVQTSNSNLPPQVNLRFAIIDTGIGVSPQNVSKIFQPFQQINKLDVNESSTGLGLAICQQLVELMGGELKVQSELDRGSIFWFDVTFPEIKITSRIEATSVSEIVGYKGQRRTLLLVDDDRVSRLILLDILKPLGFKVITAENGQQGLRLASQNRPDLILTDLFMPIKTGFTLVPEIRKIKYLRQVPIIAISATNFEEVEKQSQAIGCDAYLTKPIDNKKLLDLLGKYQNLEWIYKGSQT
jgi:signal transduction histidine kinase/ActR/RegA family two-component response regulator